MKYRNALSLLLVVLPGLWSCSSEESNTQPEVGDSPAAALPGLFTEFAVDTVTAVYDGDIKSGDIDGDGDNDLVVTGSASSGAVSKVYFNDGNGVYTDRNVNNLMAVSDSVVALNDFDRDADLDIMLLGVEGAENQAQLYLNNGAGEFTAADDQSIEPLSLPTVAVGDVDGNAADDLLVAGYTDDEYRVQVYVNNRFGEFSLTLVASHTYIDQGNHSAQLGDIDADSDLDIVVMFKADPLHHRIFVYENTGSGEFVLKSSRNVTEGILSEYYTDFHLADFDNDGDADMFLVQNALSFRHWAGFSGVYINDGEGDFGSIQHIAMPTSGVAFCSSDINRDSNLDIVAIGYYHYPRDIYIGDFLPKAEVLLNLGAMNFDNSDSDIVHGVVNGACALSDINGDGKVDLLVTGDELLEEGSVSGAADGLPAFRIYLNNTE